jgi:dynactin 1
MPSGLESYADDTHMQALLIQTYLETTAASLTHVKAFVNSKLQPSDQDEEISFFYQRLDSLATQARSSKVVAGKIARSLEELKSSSLSLCEEASNPFETSENAAKELSELTRIIGQDLNLLLTDEDHSDGFTYNEILRSMTGAISKFLDSSSTDIDPLPTLNTKLRSIASQLEALTNLSTDLTKTLEFERHSPPWIVRAQQIKTSKTISPDIEEEMCRLQAELAERSTALGVRDKTLEENSIKIELLESRIREANKKSTLIHDLEAQLEAAKKRETDLSNAIEVQMKELQAMELDRDNYKRRVRERPLTTSEESAGLSIPEEHAAVMTATKTIESLRLEITGLQATIRYLQDDNHRLHLSDPASTRNSVNAFLNEPLVPRKISIEQEKRRHIVKAECQDILTSLLKMTKEAKFVEVKGPIATSTAAAKDGKKRESIWRPMKETSRYQTLKTREEWEGWRGWRDEVVKRETGWEGRIGMRGFSKGKSNPPAQSATKASKGSDVTGKKVKIVD